MTESQTLHRPDSHAEQPIEQDADTSRRRRSGVRYRIMHDAVGSLPMYMRGDVVGADAFEPESRARLEEIGAIVPAGEDSPPQWTLPAALRSESPPTLPNAPFVDASERALLLAAGAIPLEARRPEEMPPHP